MLAAALLRRYSGHMIDSFILLVLILAAKQSFAAKPCPKSWQLNSQEERKNQNHNGDPVFWLRVAGAKNGYEVGQSYTFTIESYSGRTTITDLLATTESDQPKCGNGKFSVRPDGYLYQPDRCLSVVSFGSKKSLRKVQFQWTPPRCACATIRITVKSIQGFYYSGNTLGDALYRRICPKDMTSRKPAKIPLMTFEEEVTKMKQESLSQLCHHVEEERTSDSFPVNFLEPRQLNDLEKSDPRWDFLQLALEERRIEVQTCCGITDTFNRQECFEDIRRNRIDQLCGDGYPAVPYAKHRESWMSTRQETCCYELAESRYECFAKNSSERSSHSPDHIAFYDETHPLVDLEYYQTNPLANARDLSLSGRKENKLLLMSENGEPKLKHSSRDPAVFTPGRSRDDVRNQVKDTDRYTGGKNNANLKDDHHLVPLVSKRLKGSQDASFCCTEGLRVGQRLPTFGSRVTLRKFCNIVRTQYQDANFQRDQSACSKAFLNCCIQSANSERGTPTTTVGPTEQSQSKKRRGRKGKVLKQRKTPQKASRLQRRDKFSSDIENGGYADGVSERFNSGIDGKTTTDERNRRVANGFRSLEKFYDGRTTGIKSRGKARKLRGRRGEYDDDGDGDDDGDEGGVDNLYNYDDDVAGSDDDSDDFDDVNTDKNEKPETEVETMKTKREKKEKKEETGMSDDEEEKKKKKKKKKK
ncbi:uncharacterized protein LOC115231448 [Octopus sinensis]|uniref:Uncharacterized protein LOC115231448 n=1 Tax=Octopus sinensis TaxID=2607531 RepID=A0A7E6EKV6_9MOLL|nr:uncharacterized protein LOC115231448 [Octopus sinensis]